jgi:putative membrane protein
MTDLILASLHHLAVFGLFGVFLAELTAIRPGATDAELRKAGKLDIAFGVLAAVVLVVGVLRLLYGGKGWAFYQENVWFWAKMAAFAAVGALSVYPTLKLLAWRKAERAGAPGPTDAEIRAVRRVLHLEALFFLLIPIFAAAMARHGAF